MLSLLVIRNFALIENLELEPVAGFTVLTGETGAGKSIVLAALNLLLGGKAAADLIRQGEDQAQVEAMFHDEDQPEELILKRVVSREGRNRVQINGSLNTLSNLAATSTNLVSLCGQHEQQTLLKPEEHLLLLDAFAGLDGQRNQVVELVRRVNGVEAQIKELSENLSRQEERQLWLTHQIKELAEANLVAGEDVELLEEQKLLANVGQRADLSQQAYYMLYGAEKSAALVALNKALSNVRQLMELDPKLGELGQSLEDAYYSLEDVAHQLRDYHSRIAHEPGRLDWVEERLNQLQRLTRRYGGSVEDALLALEKARQELDSLENGQDSLARLEKKKEEAIADALAAAAELSQARRQAAPGFARQVMDELHVLGMPDCVFEVRFNEPGGQCINTRQGKLGRRGLEMVEFYLAPNPGEGFRPLARTASGGELSRLLLALRSLTARTLGSPTLIFDEVDAGIGGDIGMAIGRKLAGLAKDAQVICITHLPQIAAFADCHFQVSKQISDGRTSTRLKRLDGQERLQELARMLGSGNSALDHARDLLTNSGVAF